MPQPSCPAGDARLAQQQAHVTLPAPSACPPLQREAAPLWRRLFSSEPPRRGWEKFAPKGKGRRPESKAAKGERPLKVAGRCASCCLCRGLPITAGAQQHSSTSSNPLAAEAEASKRAEGSSGGSGGNGGPSADSFEALTKRGLQQLLPVLMVMLAAATLLGAGRQDAQVRA